MTPLAVTGTLVWVGKYQSALATAFCARIMSGIPRVRPCGAGPLTPPPAFAEPATAMVTTVAIPAIHVMKVLLRIRNPAPRFRVVEAESVAEIKVPVAVSAAVPK
jgi:hypothetical protein